MRLIGILLMAAVLAAIATGSTEVLRIVAAITFAVLVYRLLFWPR